jgi:hypothetical protein
MDTVAHNTQEAKAGGCKFKANLDYIMSTGQPVLQSETLSQNQNQIRCTRP